MALWCPESALADRPPTFTLQEIMALALKYNPGVAASQAQREAARAGQLTASAYPNPVIEAGAGPSLYKDGREGVDSNWAFGVSQPIDYLNTKDWAAFMLRASKDYADLIKELDIKI